MIDNKTSQVWFEVFNPTNELLYLSSFRLSDVKTPNILPPEIRTTKGVALEPGGRIILCGDIESFEERYGKDIKVIQITSLTNIGDGGFVVMNHLEGIENTKNIIRYGKWERSLLVADLVPDNQILEITKDGMSYVRNFDVYGSLSNWSKTIPAPGK